MQYVNNLSYLVTSHLFILGNVQEKEIKRERNKKRDKEREREREGE
jgi:hypothetical protein